MREKNFKGSKDQSFRSYEQFIRTDENVPFGNLGN